MSRSQFSNQSCPDQLSGLLRREENLVCKDMVVTTKDQIPGNLLCKNPTGPGCREQVWGTHAEPPLDRARRICQLPSCTWGNRRPELSLGNPAKDEECSVLLRLPFTALLLSFYTLVFCRQPDPSPPCNASTFFSSTPPTPPPGWKCSTPPHPCPHLHPLRLAWPRSLPSTAGWRSSRLAEDFLDLDQFLRTVRPSPSLPHSANRRQTPDARS